MVPFCDKMAPFGAILHRFGRVLHRFRPCSAPFSAVFGCVWLCLAVVSGCGVWLWCWVCAGYEVPQAAVDPAKLGVRTQALLGWAQPCLAGSTAAGGTQYPKPCRSRSGATPRAPVERAATRPASVESTRTHVEARAPRKARVGPFLGALLVCERAPAVSAGPHGATGVAPWGARPPVVGGGYPDMYHDPCTGRCVSFGQYTGTGTHPATGRASTHRWHTSTHRADPGTGKSGFGLGLRPGPEPSQNSLPRVKITYFTGNLASLAGLLEVQKGSFWASKWPILGQNRPKYTWFYVYFWPKSSKNTCIFTCISTSRDTFTGGTLGATGRSWP